ncbi:DegT/DnrJ/EryC1/StrS family aminotransferase, partial [bacterium]|nr:DegT/DnrJ/EryC1/StrS family aminotransferase [bacterium]
GYNYRMDAFQGAVLGIKLKRLDGWNAARRGHADAYRRHLADVPAVAAPIEPAYAESVYHLFVVELDERDDAARQLDAAGIHTGLHYPVPVHLQPAYAHLGLGEGSFPAAEALARRCLSLPMFPELTDPQVATVCDGLASATAT